MTDDDVLVRFFIELVDGGFAAGVEVDGESRYLPQGFRTRRAALRAAKALAWDLGEFARAHGVEPKPATKQ